MEEGISSRLTVSVSVFSRVPLVHLLHKHTLFIFHMMHFAAAFLFLLLRAFDRHKKLFFLIYFNLIGRVTSD